MIDLCDHCRKIINDAINSTSFIYPRLETLKRQGIRRVNHNKCEVCIVKCPVEWDEIDQKLFDLVHR